MDSSPTGILAIVGVAISGFTIVLGAINHYRVRSNCLGHKLEMSLDVEKTTPPGHPQGGPSAPADSQEALKISVPQA